MFRPTLPLSGSVGLFFRAKKMRAKHQMLRSRSLSIKLSVSLFRADKIGSFTTCIVAKTLCSVNAYPMILYAAVNHSVPGLRQKSFPPVRPVQISSAVLLQGWPAGLYLPK